MDHADKIKNKVFDYIREHRLLSSGDTVVAGVSGGADSVCLLFLLLEWKKICPLTVTVVHVNHGLREDAGLDAEFVEELCRSYHIPFELWEADVGRRALEEKISSEEAGRLARYEAFEKVCGKYGAGKVAVAHNMNDKAETMLFHLFRGSGLSGLCGIRPRRDGIIRPLLCLERQEIEDYLRYRGVKWRVDSTNLEDGYTRNRIRHHIIPYAEHEIVKGCVLHMSQTSDMLLETENYLEEQANRAEESLVQRKVEEGVLVSARIGQAGFVSLHQVIGKRVLYRLMKELSPGGRDIGYVHIRDLMSLFYKEGNRELCLPYGITGRRSYGDILLERERDKTRDCGADKAGERIRTGTGDKAPETEGFHLHVDLETLAGNGFRSRLSSLGMIDMQVFSYQKTEDIPQNEYTKWFDYDKIKKSLMVRTRKTGDFFTIRGESQGEKRKSVKDYMVDDKIPRADRDAIPLLAEGEHILWVVGYRISEYYKISKNTKRILQVQLRRDCESSGMEENNGRTC